MDEAPENRERLASPDENESELLRPKYWSEEMDLAPPNLCCAASEELGGGRNIVDAWVMAAVGRGGGDGPGVETKK